MWLDFVLLFPLTLPMHHHLATWVILVWHLKASQCNVQQHHLISHFKWYHFIYLTRNCAVLQINKINLQLKNVFIFVIFISLIFKSWHYLLLYVCHTHTTLTLSQGICTKQEGLLPMFHTSKFHGCCMQLPLPLLQYFFENILYLVIMLSSTFFNSSWDFNTSIESCCFVFFFGKS